MRKFDCEKESYFDIAIVGGGPAGSSFAREMSGHGLSILLIDGQNYIGNKPCGGLLAPDAQKIFASHDFVLPKDILVDPQIFSVKTIDIDSGLICNYQRYYLNMDRRAFDNHLLSLISDEVTYLEGKLVKAVKKSGCFDLDISAERQIKITCKYLVGADGAASIVRKTFFKQKINKYTAIQQWFDYPEEGSPYYSCIFDPITSRGCSWTIHKDGHLIYGGSFDMKNCREAFDNQLKRFQDFIGVNFGHATKTEACLVCSPKHYKEFVTGRDGVYLIGEAAGFISASSLEGISSAFTSAKMLAKAFDKSSDKHEISRCYRKFIRPLKFKLMGKIIKHNIIFTPWLRKIIMKSGITTIK